MSVSKAAPPTARSSTALGLSYGAASGQFLVQVCASCKTEQYPPRDACRRCLGSDLEWREAENGGILDAVTTIRSSNEIYFQDRLPWRVGLVSSATGLSYVVHVLPGCQLRHRVVLKLAFDAAGRTVVLAEPEVATTDVSADIDVLTGEPMRPFKSDFLFDPAARIVLVTDGSSALGEAVTGSILSRGVKHILAGRGSGQNRDANEYPDNNRVSWISHEEAVALKHSGSTRHRVFDAVIDTLE